MIKRKLFLEIKNYEISGQLMFFGRDNLSFKTINLPNAQKFKNLCTKFKLKKIFINQKCILPVIVIRN